MKQIKAENFSPLTLQKGDYLKKLSKIETQLPNLLLEKEEWHGIDINYHPPRVERIWRQYNDLRIYLHRIYPSDSSNVLFHTHPWPSAVRILNGTYEMALGYGLDNPPIASLIILAAGSIYEMIDLNSWHYVCPISDVSYSLMIAGKPWPGRDKKSELDLSSLPNSTKGEIINQFMEWYPVKDF